MSKILILILLIILLGSASYFLFGSQIKTNMEKNQNSIEDENAQKKSNISDLPDVKKDPSQEEASVLYKYEIEGMKVEILREGTGERSKKGDIVSVHYVGKLENGQEFDSSIERNKPFTFTLGDNLVIEGWELGVLGMKTGEKRRLTIPPELGYGNQGAGGVIPPVSTLIFEVEIVEILK